MEPFTVYTFQLNNEDPVVTLDVPSFKDIPYVHNMDENTKALPAEKIHVVDKLVILQKKVHGEDKLESKTEETCMKRTRIAHLHLTGT